jgi:hypothetical protein
MNQLTGENLPDISDLRHLDQRKKLLMIEYLREKLEKERE